MNKTIIYFSFSVWALLSACTAEQSEVLPKEKDGKVTIQAGTRSNNSNANDEYPFEIGQMIVIYNGIQPNDVFNENNPDKIGIYKATRKEAVAWENLPLERPEAQGLWKADMKADATSDKFIFTAITYHEGQDLAEEGKHQVSTDQSTEAKILENDFLVARSTYNKDWTNGHINLKFRHVLSRLDVKLYLPIGNENDGLFKEDILSKAHAVTLKGAALDYNVNYAYPKLDHNGLAGINPDKNNQRSGNIMMYPYKAEKVTLPTDNNAGAIMFHFQCILPSHQDSYTAGSECLHIEINGKKYTYKPESSGIMAFEQERITTINLTLYSKKGQNRVNLTKIQITDWKEDKTNIGDLIE